MIFFDIQLDDGPADVIPPFNWEEVILNIALAMCGVLCLVY